MGWHPLKEAARQLGCSEITVQRRTKLPDDDPRYLPSEREPYRSGERILVLLPDDAPAAPPSEPSAQAPPGPVTDTSAVMAILQHQADANSRAIELLQEYHGQALAAKDETIATLQVERDAMQIQIEKLREQLARAQARPWWRFWE